MIASIPRKTGDRPRTFKGTVQYVLRADHGPSIVGGTVLGLSPEDASRRTAEILREFESIRRLRPEVKDPVVHMSLSFAPGDRRLSQAELADIAEKFVARLGYTQCQYVAVGHDDRAHQHLHIIVNRVRLDGSLNPRPYNDWFRAMTICRQLEKEYGLTRVERSKETGVRAPTREEIEHGAKVGNLSERMRLQRVVLSAAQARPTLSQFTAELQQQGISIRFHLGPDREPIGVSYHGGKYPFAGSALGPSYTFQGIQREGVQVDLVRDVGGGPHDLDHFRGLNLCARGSAKRA